MPCLTKKRHGLKIDRGMYRKFSYRFLTGIVASTLLIASGGEAFSQSAPDAVSRPLEKDADVIRKGRVDAPEGDGIQPSQGVTLFDRMGADLPPLPPEKEFKGKIDEAYGAFQRGEYVTALDKALTRAQAGDAAAQTLVAEMMSRGLGIASDPKTAAFWYGQAANGGDPAAMFQYALLLMQGKNVTRDKAKADEFMRKAADAGNASAQFNWAQILVSENPGAKGLSEALPYYEKSAEQGVADAQYAVAQIYVSVSDIGPEKSAQARDWMLRAAKAGFDTAQLDMGVWLVNGVGGPRDYNEGYNWMQRAALKGNVAAQNKLSHLYIQALGTRPDPVEAAKWYVLSRRAGMKDLALEDFYLGLTDEQQKQAIDAANKFRRS
jgi:TPR repeat protein